MWPENTLVIARELTKTYESLYRITKVDLLDIREKIVDKGEFVLLFHSAIEKKTAGSSDEVVSLTRDYLENGGSTKKLAKILSKVLGSDTKTIYDQLSRSVK